MIEKLDNNEQVLLMYLADELPPEDRVEVDQMLAVDANLRDELRRLEEADGLMRQALPTQDEASALPSTESAAVRRVSREIRRRFVRTVAAPEPYVASERRRSMWWLYPTAAAAIVILAAAVWMPRHGNNPRVPNRPLQGIDRFSTFYANHRLFLESWDEPDALDVPSAPPDAVAMSDGPKDTAVAVDDPLNQLLLSADANQ